MEIMEIWFLLGALAAVAVAQSKYYPEYLSQDSYSEPDESSYKSYRRDYPQSRSYEPSPHDGRYDSKYYQSIESKYSKPQEENYPSHSSYHIANKQTQYSPAKVHSYYRQPAIAQQPEISSYHDSQDGYDSQDVPHQPDDSSYQRYQDGTTQQGVPLHGSQDGYGSEGIKNRPAVSSYHSSQNVPDQPDAPSYITPEDSSYKPELPSYKRLREIAYQKATASKHQESGDYPEPDDNKYSAEDEPEYSRAPVRSAPHPAPVPVDPKLPLYFTMYEKRVIADPTDKYGKGPWRFLTYGHGITYGSKEPGKVFEKGYGYIRALGRDTCKLPEHLCPPKDGKPFEYDGRKEPYFGYRPH